MAEQFSIPTVGDLIAGRYRVEEELGRGAYGVVFRADQEELGRDVAVKTLLPQAFLQQDIVQRFHREAHLITRLDHPNIIRIYDYGVDEGLLYMAVEYVEGRTLMDIIENDAPLEPVRVRDLTLQILDALEHAHEKGIVHRDLKPENIVLLETTTSDGREFEVVKILDFGISKLLQGDEEQNALKSLTQDGTVLGTPHYMSPENIVGDPVDHRADLYAVGVLLYEMLTGEHPFEAPSPSAVMVRHLRDDPEPLPEQFEGTALGTAIHRCLEKQPWDRVGSARELIEILEEALDELPTLSGHRPRSMSGPREPARVELPDIAVDDTIVEDSPETSRTKVPWAPLIGILVVLVVLAVSIGWKVWQAIEALEEKQATTVVVDPGESEKPELATTETSPPDEPEPVGVAEPVPEVEPVIGSDAGRDEPEDDPTVDPAEEPPPEARPPERKPATQEQPPEKKPDKKPVAKKRNKPEKRPDEPDRPPAAPEKKPTKRTVKNADSDPDDPEASPDEVATVVDLKITSTPTNIAVNVAGTPVGRTPLTHSVPAGEPIVVRFSHIGYADKSVTVTPSADNRTVHARLVKAVLTPTD